MKRPPKHAPARIDSTGALRAFQRLMASAVTRPLNERYGLQGTWTDGRPMAEVAGEFVKPNDRLSAFERLELYNQLYWSRLYNAIEDDCPGLRAVLGAAAFDRLATAYLAECPSGSFTLRNLCSRLEGFIRRNPRLTAPRTAFAIEVARFEWAQTIAFDSERREVVGPEELAGTPPARLRLALQPYVTLLELAYPVDTFVISVKRRDALRSEASNTPEAGAPGPARIRRARLPGRARTFVAVHRHHNRLFYKRLDPAAFRILEQISEGKALAAAIAAGGRGVKPHQVRRWFKTWMALGWFCPRGNKPRGGAS